MIHMKKALVAGGLVVVTTLATTLTNGPGAAAGPEQRPARQIMNSGLCVAFSDFLERAADPSDQRGPAVQTFMEDDLDRTALGTFSWSMACLGRHTAI